MKLDLAGMKIPKTVAGVKVPKKLRKRGKKLLAKAQSPQGQEAIAAGLTIAGTMLAANARARAAKATTRDPQWAGEPPVTPQPPIPPAPPRPGTPGIDPARDPFGQFGNELNEVIASGVASLQRFLAGGRKS